MQGYCLQRSLPVGLVSQTQVQKRLVFAACRSLASSPRPKRRFSPLKDTWARSSSPTREVQCCAATKTAGGASQSMTPIALTDKALGHLKKLQAENEDNRLLFRVGVRSGGCSGMSYVMEFESEENVKEDDAVFEYDDGNFKMICDPKSLLYLFGMRLDYSDALIGGGFQFHNPNATDTCGCGKSFGV